MIKYAGFLAESSMAGDSSDEERKKRETPPPVEFIRPEEPQAAPPPQERPAAWVPQPEEYGRRPQEPFPQAWPQAARPSRRALLGGVFLLLSGLIGAASAYIAFTQPLTPAEISTIQNMTAADLAANALLVFLVVYAQAFAFLGGIMALQRKNWKLAVFCGAASLLNLGIFFLGSLAGLAGLILIIMARRDFLG
jgi:hypothetical protein